MVGPRFLAHYVNDTGATYAVSIPAWQQALAGGTAATGVDLQPPKGFRPRYRMLYNTANGREKKVVCTVIGSAFWTEAMNTAHTAVDDGTTAGIANAKTAGRVGEKTKNI